MIFSKEQLFTPDTSTGQQLAATTPTVSSNVIDLGIPGTVRGGPAKLIRDIGPGEPVAVSVTANPTGGANTMTVELIQSTVAAMTSPDVLGTSRATTLAAGKPVQFGFNFLPDGITKQFIALRFTLGTATNVNIDAGITAGKQSNVTVAAA